MTAKSLASRAESSPCGDPCVGGAVESLGGGRLPGPIHRTRGPPLRFGSPARGQAAAWSQKRSRNRRCCKAVRLRSAPQSKRKELGPPTNQAPASQDLMEFEEYRRSGKPLGRGALGLGYQILFSSWAPGSQDSWVIAPGDPSQALHKGGLHRRCTEHRRRLSGSFVRSAWFLI